MKRSIVFSLAIAYLLLSVVGPVIAQMDREDRGMGDRKNASDMMEYGKSVREKEDMHGMGFIHSDENSYGEYVTFTIDNQTGAILNYGVMGISLFNISIANFNYGSTSPHDSMTRVSNTDGSIKIQLHDNPAGVINILTSKSVTVTFTLANGVSATNEDNLIRIESGNVVGYIAGNDISSSSVSGSKVIIDTSSNSAVVFRIKPVNMPVYNDLHRRLSDEIERDEMGMEATIGQNRTYNSVNYSARLQMRVQEMDKDHIRLQINATEPAGHIIAINLDNSSLMITDRDRLRINYDGMALQCVDDQNVVFNASDRPVCWISPIQDRVRAQLIVRVPSYSVHTIDIVVEPGIATPANTTMIPAQTPKTPGFELIISLVGLLICVLLGKRSNN